MRREMFLRVECIWSHTCENPHGPVHGTDVSADQHLHQQGEELRPGLGPVPVGDGRHGVGDTGADFADGLSQAAGQQLPDGSFSLEEENKRWALNSPQSSNYNVVTRGYLNCRSCRVDYLICGFRRPELLWLGTPVSLHILLQDDWC